MSDPVQITDHEGRGVERLLARTSGKPRLEALFRSWLSAPQSAEDVAWALRSMLLLSTASGRWLDFLGAKVGERRGGRSDEVYRVWIGARVLVNRSSGTAPQLIAIVDAVTPAGTRIHVQDEYPAAITVHAYGPVSHDVGNAIAALLQQAKAAGVRCLFRWHSPEASQVFRLGAVQGATDSGRGLGVGQLAAVSQRGNSASGASVNPVAMVPIEEFSYVAGARTYAHPITGAVSGLNANVPGYTYVGALDGHGRTLRVVQVDDQGGAYPEVRTPSSDAAGAVAFAPWSAYVVPRFASGVVAQQHTIASVDEGVAGVAYEGVAFFDLDDDGATGCRARVVVDGVVAAQSAFFTFAAMARLRIRFDAQAGEIEVAGAATGNGVTSVAPWSHADGSLRIGVVDNGIGGSASPCNGHVSTVYPDAGDPALLAGRVLDYVPDRATPGSGSGVASLLNLAGSAHDAVQATPADQPTADTVGGFSVVVFDGSQDLEVTGADYVQAGDYPTVAVVARFETLANRTLFEAHAGEAGSGFRLERVAGQLRFVAVTPEGEAVAAVTFGDVDSWHAFRGRLLPHGVEVAVDGVVTYVPMPNAGLASGCGAASIGQSAAGAQQFDGPVMRITVAVGVSDREATALDAWATSRAAAATSAGAVQTPLDVAGANVTHWREASPATVVFGALGDPDVETLTGGAGAGDPTNATSLQQPHLVGGVELQHDTADARRLQTGTIAAVLSVGDGCEVFLGAGWPSYAGNFCALDIGNGVIRWRGHSGPNGVRAQVLTPSGLIDCEHPGAPTGLALWSVRLDASDGAITLSRNGVDVGSAVSAAGGINASATVLAVGSAVGGSVPHNGTYRGHVVCNRLLTTQERADMVALLMTRWGIA